MTKLQVVEYKFSNKCILKHYNMTKLKLLNIYHIKIKLVRKIKVQNPNSANVAGLPDIIS